MVFCWCCVGGGGGGWGGGGGGGGGGLWGGGGVGLRKGPLRDFAEGKLSDTKKPE